VATWFVWKGNMIQIWLKNPIILQCGTIKVINGIVFGSLDIPRIWSIIVLCMAAVTDATFLCHPNMVYSYAKHDKTISRCHIVQTLF